MGWSLIIYTVGNPSSSFSSSLANLTTFLENEAAVGGGLPQAARFKKSGVEDSE